VRWSWGGAPFLDRPTGRRPVGGTDLVVGSVEGLAEPVEGSFVVAYLNRLSDLLWAMARWQEGPEHTLSKG